MINELENRISSEKLVSMNSKMVNDSYQDFLKAKNNFIINPTENIFNEMIKKLKEFQNNL